MSEQAANGPAPAGPASGGSGPPDGSGARPSGEERVVVRDNRKIDPTGTSAAPAPASSDAAAGSPGSGGTGAASPADQPGAASPVGETGPAGSSGQSGPGPGAGAESPAATDRSDGRAGVATSVATEESEASAAGQAPPAGADTGAPASAGSNGPGVDGSGPAGAEPSTGDAGSAEAEKAATEPAATEPAGRPLGAELDSLRAELDERTRDLQRLSAEYANYRKRVDRDRGLAAEQTTAHVLSALLPVLDDLDRAREHGDLVGPFGAVADQLITATGKFGLTPFGEKGDPFDPTRHEAVAHLTSAEVTEPTCVEVMRRGYLLGDRLLRPAMVAVADPE